MVSAEGVLQEKEKKAALIHPRRQRFTLVAAGHISCPIPTIHVYQEEIQAMVDLAYWSDFDTSRRDAASAFATLSMNGDGL